MEIADILASMGAMLSKLDPEAYLGGYTDIFWWIRR